MELIILKKTLLSEVFIINKTKKLNTKDKKVVKVSKEGDKLNSL